MPRVLPMTIAAVLSIVLLALGLLAPAAYAQAERPNIVLIVTDDQRWDTFSGTSAASVMPTVYSDLIQQGVKFTNMFAATPLCVPSRAGILTGQYPHHNNVWNNSMEHGYPVFDDTQTLAVWLKGLQEAGYRTSLIGKYLNGYPGELGNDYIPTGWNNWVAFLPDEDQASNAEVGYYDFAVNENGVPREFHRDFEHPENDVYSTDYLGDKAVEFITASENSNSPIFLMFTPKAPHMPAIPADRHKTLWPNLPVFRPASFNENDISDKPSWLADARPDPGLDGNEIADSDEFRHNQLRTLRAVDEAIDAILDALRTTGRLDAMNSDTMIVFMSDNGFSWGEHRWTSKVTPYEEDIRLPLVIRYDKFPANLPRQVNRSALNIDIAPTLLDLAGALDAPPPEFIVDGISLLPYIRNDSSLPLRNEFIVEYAQEIHGQILDEPEEYVPTYCAVRRVAAGGMGLQDEIYTRLDPEASEYEEEFYDLDVNQNPNNRYQLVNVVNESAYMTRVNALRTLWANDLCYHDFPDPPPPGPGRKP